MASERSMRGLVTFVALLLGGGVGFAARGALERERAVPPPVIGAEQLVALSLGIERVESALSELAGRLDILPPPIQQTPITRTALGEPEEQRLSELVERLERVAVASRPVAPMLLIPERRAQPLPPRTSGEQEDERDRRFELWTCQQVADSFGRPDRVSSSNGEMVWMYRREPVEEGTYDELHFRFVDGLVVNVND